jgi:DNA helicase-2/ATP-dependent DNA helicase PcrA
VEELKLDNTPESQSRIENIDELLNKIVEYEETSMAPDLSELLEEISLVADIDGLEEDANRVVLMTLHSAKGLEFPEVYLTGMEDGIFPSYMTITSDDPMEIEEERRLCYVGITRAMERLSITSAKMRMIRGETQYNKLSRFVREIPTELLGHAPEKERLVFTEKMSNAVNPAYRQAKNAFQAKVSYQTEAVNFNSGSTEGRALGYGVGDRVRHLKFGEGTVTGIVAGGKDFEVTVAFDTYGTKKMFAIFAKLKKI